MKVRIKGEMSMTATRQALFEQICALEELYRIRHCRGVTLFLTPTNGFGDVVVPRKDCGAVIDVVYTDGPYRCLADEYNL